MPRKHESSSGLFTTASHIGINRLGKHELHLKCLNLLWTWPSSCSSQRNVFPGAAVTSKMSSGFFEIENIKIASSNARTYSSPTSRPHRHARLHLRSFFHERRNKEDSFGNTLEVAHVYVWQVSTLAPCVHNRCAVTNLIGPIQVTCL